MVTKVQSPMIKKGNEIAVTAVGSTTPRTLEERFSDFVNVKDFEGLVDSDDWHPAIIAALDYAVSSNTKDVRLPSGEFNVRQELNLTEYNKIRLMGAGKHSTSLVFPDTTRCIVLDKNHLEGFKFGHSLQDFEVVGNATTTSHIFIANCHHMKVADINTREGSSSACFSLDVTDSVGSNFTNFSCSTNSQPMTNRVYVGIRVHKNLVSGVRATDNVFIMPIIEGTVGDGIVVDESDLSTFIGGTSENNTANGVTIINNARMNTFIGMGFENLGYYDIYDDGVSSKFLNCYSSKLFYAGPNSRFGRIDGGIWERVETNVGADHYQIDNIDIKYWTSIGSPRDGGLFDNSSTTKTGNIWDSALGISVYPSKIGAILPVTTSPFVFDNNTGVSVSLSYAGVISVAYVRRGGLNQYQTASEGNIVLNPGDGIELTFTGTPTVAFVPLSQML